VDYTRPSCVHKMGLLHASLASDTKLLPDLVLALHDALRGCGDVCINQDASRAAKVRGHQGSSRRGIYIGPRQSLHSEKLRATSSVSRTMNDRFEHHSSNDFSVLLQVMCILSAMFIFASCVFRLNPRQGLPQQQLDKHSCILIALSTVVS